jgi:MoaA/NifB/PqqE/SkfB family radical SAM enzyme
MDASNKNLVLTTEEHIREFVVNIFRFNIRNYRLAPFFIRTLFNQRKGLASRIENRKKGLEIPYLLWFSITSKCNLDCVGCYYKSQKRDLKEDLPDVEIIRILGEAHDLGIRNVLLLGGEPFMRDVFHITAGFPDMLFAVYTNSTMIDESMIKMLRRRHNIIPVLSLEGYSETDKRRGPGILANIKRVAGLLKKNKIFYGLSYTVTRGNFNEIIKDEFIKMDIKMGCGFFNFFEYIPLDSNTRDLMLTKEQRPEFVKFITSFRSIYKSHVLSPVLETIKFGQCVAASEVIHISSDGYLEPCPFIAFSDTSVREMPLAQAMKSRFLLKVRSQLPFLEEKPEHSCKLFTNRDWIIETLAEGKSLKVVQENVNS